MAEARKKFDRPTPAPKGPLAAKTVRIAPLDEERSSSSSGAVMAIAVDPPLLPSPSLDTRPVRTPSPTQGMVHPRDDQTTPRDAPAAIRSRSTSMEQDSDGDDSNTPRGDLGTSEATPGFSTDFRFAGDLSRALPSVPRGRTMRSVVPRDPATRPRRMRAQLEEMTRNDALSLFRTDPRFMASASARSLEFPAMFDGRTVRQATASLAHSCETVYKTMNLAPEHGRILHQVETSPTAFRELFLTQTDSCIDTVLAGVDAIAGAYRTARNAIEEAGKAAERGDAAGMLISTLLDVALGESSGAPFRTVRVPPSDYADEIQNAIAQMRAQQDSFEHEMRQRTPLAHFPRNDTTQPSNDTEGPKRPLSTSAPSRPPSRSVKHSKGKGRADAPTTPTPYTPPLPAVANAAPHAIIAPQPRSYAAAAAVPPLVAQAAASSPTTPRSSRQPPAIGQRWNCPTCYA